MENKVLAVVEGKEITQKDLDFLLAGIGPQRAMQFNNEEGKKKLLDELINQEMFYLDAKEQGLDQEEAFKMELQHAKENILKQMAIKQLLDSIEVSDEEVKEYYEANKEQFVSEESVKASHILVKDEEVAKELLAKLKEGSSFEEVAKESSECPSKAQGGSLGEFTRGKMVPEFEEAAFKLAIGELSDLVKTQFGYHIIKVTDKKEAGTKKFDEVQSQIKNQLLAMKQNKEYLNKTNSLRSKYKFEVK
ncbi:peptidylprolyl isomerase [Clostridiaceae bacterium M8S5]|nr:peptidylprolyl isomerase [Clostridiaceae bacterium M8S5]